MHLEGISVNYVQADDDDDDEIMLGLNLVHLYIYLQGGLNQPACAMV